MPDWSWIEGLAVAVTATDRTGRIIAMNARAREEFAGDGALVGTNVLDCHPEPARSKTAVLYREQRDNHYTIQKHGRRKIIHQLPWYRDGRFAGIVEISVPLPEHLPHFDRDIPGGG